MYCWIVNYCRVAIVLNTSGDRSSTESRIPIIALLAANIISDIGNILTMLAIPWFVLVTTGSASRAGITVAVGAAPIILAGVFGGPIVDRLGYRRASIVADLASGATVLLIPLLYSTVGLEFWQLLVLVFLGALLDLPGHTARYALLPELVERSAVDLERANAGYAIAVRIAGLAGPPLGGLLIVAIGASNLLWFDAATFAMSALIVGLLVPNVTAMPAATDDEPARSYLQDMREGFAFLQRDSVLFWLVVITALGNLLAEPLYGIILPVYAREVFGSAFDLGIIFAALAAGSLAGNGMYLLIGKRFSRRAIILTGFSIRALSFWPLIFIPSLWVIVACIFVNSLFLEPVNPLVMTIRQERVPAGMRGRVFGASMALGAGLRPLGLFVYGLLLDSAGLETTLLIFAAVNLIVPLAIIAAPGLRDIRRPEAAQPGTAG